ATPPAVKHLLEVARSTDKEQRERAIEGLKFGGRWAAPILIELLDDLSLRRTYRDEPSAPTGKFDGHWPDEHPAYSALTVVLAATGLKGKDLDLAEGGKFDLDVEIAHLKSWWRSHSQDFLQGKPVPNPMLTTVVVSYSE